MQKMPIAFLLAGLMLLTPLASASATYADTLPSKVPVVIGPSFMYSDPVFESTKVYDINAGVGDTVTASLTWTSTATLPVPNDLDLTLLLPSGAPVPLPIPPTPNSLLALVNSREARETCTDTAASSHNHQLLDGPSSEALKFTVPSGGEVGKYTLLVRGWTLTADQPYTLSLTVTSGGQDVTASRAAPEAGYTVFITTAPNCELVDLPPLP